MKQEQQREERMIRLKLLCFKIDSSQVLKAFAWKSNLCEFNGHNNNHLLLFAIDMMERIDKFLDWKLKIHFYSSGEQRKEPFRLLCWGCRSSLTVLWIAMKVDDDGYNQFGRKIFGNVIFAEYCYLPNNTRSRTIEFRFQCPLKRFIVNLVLYLFIWNVFSMFAGPFSGSNYYLALNFHLCWAVVSQRLCACGFSRVEICYLKYPKDTFKFKYPEHIPKRIGFPGKRRETKLLKR